MKIKNGATYVDVETGLKATVYAVATDRITGEERVIYLPHDSSNPSTIDKSSFNKTFTEVRM